MWRRLIIGGTVALALCYFLIWGWLLFTAHQIHIRMDGGQTHTAIAVFMGPSIKYHVMPPGIDITRDDGPTLRLRITTLGPQVVIWSIDLPSDLSFSRLKQPWPKMGLGDFTFSDIRLVDGPRSLTLTGYRDQDGGMDFKFDYHSQFVQLSGSGQGQWQESLALEISAIDFPTAPAMIKRPTGWINWRAGAGITGQTQAGLFQLGDDLILTGPIVQLEVTDDIKNITMRAGRGSDEIAANLVKSSDKNLRLEVQPGPISHGHLTWTNPNITLQRIGLQKWTGRINTAQTLFDVAIRDLSARVFMNRDSDQFDLTWNGKGQSGQSGGPVELSDITLPIGPVENLSLNRNDDLIRAKTTTGQTITGRITDNQFRGRYNNGSFTLNLNNWTGRAVSAPTPITTDQVTDLFGPVPVSNIQNGQAVITTRIDRSDRQSTAEFSVEQMTILDQEMGGIFGDYNAQSGRLDATYTEPADGNVTRHTGDGWMIEQSIFGGKLECQMQVVENLTDEFNDEVDLCQAKLSNLSLDRVLNLTSAHMLEASGRLNGTVELYGMDNQLKIGQINLSGGTGAISLPDGATLAGDQAEINQHLKNLALDRIIIKSRPRVMHNQSKPIVLTASGRRPDGQDINLTLHLDIISDQLDRLME